MNAPKGCILPKPETGVGLWEISFDKNGRNGFVIETVTPDGIRSRLWPGIGYARTFGNFRKGEVPGAKRNFRITEWVTNMPC